MIHQKVFCVDLGKPDRPASWRQPGCPGYCIIRLLPDRQGISAAMFPEPDQAVSDSKFLLNVRQAGG